MAQWQTSFKAGFVNKLLMFIPPPLVGTLIGKMGTYVCSSMSNMTPFSRNVWGKCTPFL